MPSVQPWEDSWRGTASSFSASQAPDALDTQGHSCSDPGVVELLGALEHQMPGRKGQGMGLRGWAGTQLTRVSSLKCPLSGGS